MAMEDGGNTITVWVDKPNRFMQPVKVRDFNKRNYPTVNSLLDTLTPKAEGLPYGPRRLTTAGGQTEIKQIEDIEVHKTYICSDKAHDLRIGKAPEDMPRPPPPFQFGHIQPPPTAPKLYWDIDKERSESRKWPASSTNDSREEGGTKGGRGRTSSASSSKGRRRRTSSASSAKGRRTRTSSASSAKGRRTRTSSASSTHSSSHGILKQKHVPLVTPSTAHHRRNSIDDASQYEKSRSPRKALRSPRRRSVTSPSTDRSKQTARLTFSGSPRPHGHRSGSKVSSAESADGSSRESINSDSAEDRRGGDGKGLAPLDKRRLPHEQRRRTKMSNGKSNISPRREERARVSKVGAAPGKRGRNGGRPRSYESSMTSTSHPFELAFEHIEPVVQHMRSTFGRRTPQGANVAKMLTFLSFYMDSAIDPKIREMWADKLVDVSLVPLVGPWLQADEMSLRQSTISLLQSGATSSPAFVTELGRAGVLDKMFNQLSICKCHK